MNLVRRWRGAQRGGSQPEGTSADVEAAFEAFRRKDWPAAVEAFREVLRGGNADRVVWLHLASAMESAGKRDRARNLTALTNELFPSDIYDAPAAFRVHPDAPAQRDEMARFLHEHLDQIQEVALARVAGAQESPKRAYMYWDTADRPAMVQMCFDAARTHLPDDYEFVELNAENLASYAPDVARVGEKVERAANLSDLIRSHLLSDGGGLWLDATVLLTDQFSDFAPRFEARDFFLFTYRGARTGSWFFWARPSSYRLQMVRAALDTWLESGRTWSNYFMFHDIVEMLYWVDERYRTEWEEGLFIHPRVALAMNDNLVKPIADHVWFDLTVRSPVNKLNWKFNEKALENDRTVVSRLLRGDTVPSIS